MPKRRAQKPIAVFVLSLGFGVIYLLTLTHFYTFDAVAFAWQVTQFERSREPGWLFHPHHLLFNALSYLFYQCFRLLNINTNPLFTTQIMNAILGMAGIWIFHGLMRRLSKEEWVVNLTTAGLGSSFAYWIAATDGRVNMVGIVLMIFALRLAVELLLGADWRLSAVMGGVVGLAALFHQSHVLFLPAALSAAAMPGRRTNEHHHKLYACLGSFSVVTLIPYCIVYSVVHGRLSLFGLFGWMTTYGRLGLWWSWEFRNLFKSARAFGHALLEEQPVRLVYHGTASSFDHWMAAFFIINALLVAVMLFWGVLKLLSHGSDRRSASICLTTGAVYGFFFTIWSPGYFMFWLPVVVIFWCIAALTLGKWQPPRLLRLPQQSLLTACVAGVFMINFWYHVLPMMNRNRNPNLVQAEVLKKHSAQHDLFLVAGTGRLAEAEIYLPFFAEREAISVNSILGRAKRSGKPDYAAEGFNELREDINKILRRGDRVFVLDELVRSDEVYKALSFRYQLNRDMFIEFLDNYTIRPAFKGYKGTVWELRDKHTGSSQL